jgi:hypothetical protein
MKSHTLSPMCSSPNWFLACNTQQSIYISNRSSISGAILQSSEMITIILLWWFFLTFSGCKTNHVVISIASLEKFWPSNHLRDLWDPIWSLFCLAISLPFCYTSMIVVISFFYGEPYHEGVGGWLPTWAFIRWKQGSQNQ